ncbi:MAG TPA: hypothetical protein VFZ69_17520 [Longimicrobiales bacterium]
MRKLFWGPVVALLLCACGETTAPEPEEESPRTLARAAGGVVLESMEASFWAVRGQGRTLVLRRADGSAALEFEVGPGSLVARPDGSVFAPNDSILISVRQRVAGGYVFDFEPSGVQFSTTAPALLRIRYDSDLNGDGVIGLADALLESTLSIWMQAGPGLPWVPIPSVRLPGQVVEGEVTHFTGFALAS